MADYYTLFSCELDVGSADNALKALDLYRAFADELEEAESWQPGFEVVIEPDGHGGRLWIHDGGNGDPEHVIQFGCRCAEAFGLTGLWGFEYANSCSRPRLDAYGGGGHVLDLATGRTIGWLSTWEWLSAQLSGGESSSSPG